MNINSNEPLFYPYSVLINKCSGSYVVKDMNLKVFNLMSRTNETGYVTWMGLVHVNID